jgi:hypothetical protein
MVSPEMSFVKHCHSNDKQTLQYSSIQSVRIQSLLLQMFLYLVRRKKTYSIPIFLIFPTLSYKQNVRPVLVTDFKGKLSRKNFHFFSSNNNSFLSPPSPRNTFGFFDHSNETKNEPPETSFINDQTDYLHNQLCEF